MNDPKELQSIIYRMLQVGAVRASNRARINSVFNGDPPETSQEAEANHSHTNTNFLRGTIQIHRARQQAINALTGPSNFFSGKLDSGPRIKRLEWADVVNRNANKIMKKSRLYDNALLSSIGQTVLHGIGPSTWMDCDEWWPTARGIDEVFVPSNTLLSLTNVTYFAIKITFTIVELLRYIDGKFTDPGWNRELILASIKVLKDRKNDQGSGGYDSSGFPEKWQEDFKEHAVFLGSDAVPVLHCYDFYFFDAESDTKCWKRRIIVDRWIDGFTGNNLSDKFLYSSEKSYGEDISQILHAQIADGCVVHPGRWWTVRSLGYLLYRVAHLDNRLQSRFFDAVFESTNTYFHNIQEGDRERIEKIDLRHLGIIPAGLQWVPANERQQVNYPLLEGALTMLQNSIQENSSSYTQNVTSGSASKEKTATEVLTQAHEAQQLLSTMLGQIYKCQIPQYREILRRLFTTNHPDCRAFRARCQADGVDKAVFDIEAWELTPEKAMGGGNRVIQLAEARALLEIRPNLTPRSQVMVDHIYIEGVTGDPGMARELASLEAPEPTSTQEKATLGWATLLDNKPIILTNDVNRNEFIQTMMMLLEKEFQDIAQGDKPDERRIIGIGNVITTVEGVVKSLESDKSQLERVKMYIGQLEQMRNLLKAEAQKVVQAQPNGQSNGELATKLITAQSDAKISEAAAAQKLHNKQAQFEQGLQHKDAKTAADIEAMGARTQVELAAQRARTRIENATNPAEV